MDVSRTLFVLFLMCLGQGEALLWPSSSDSGLEGVRKASRWNMPWLGVGMWCNGCPPKSCEDDDAIIHGYCCGCAYALAALTPPGGRNCPSKCSKVKKLSNFSRETCSNKLPIMCPEFLQCPLNLHGLCHDYEYMMRCCC